MFWLNARGLLLTIVLALAGGYVLIAHRAHIGIILSYAVLMACPILHFFMHHRAHGQGGGRHRTSAEQTGQRRRGEPS
jgi:NADH:ubiquinone oxidoreductase subunit K